ncbi:unnamed protein product [Camellia sinensis]
MDRYQKVEKPKPETPINENEIRITAQGLVRNYISYATNLLQEKRGREIVLKAMGQAISKTVAIAEIIKRRIPQLHQDTAISSVSITDVWEPIEEGLLPVEQTRHVSMISVTLSTRELDKNSPGYQAPSQVGQPKPQQNYQQQQPPRQYNYHQQQQQQQQPRQYNYQMQQQQPRQTRAPYNAVNEDSYGRGQDRGRGGYGNYQENDGYSNWGQGGGRGNDGYSNWGQGGGRGNDGYSNWGQGGGRGNDGYSNWGQGGRGRDWGYRGAGYERGRGGGGRGGYGRSRGRMGRGPRGGGNQA